KEHEIDYSRCVACMDCIGKCHKSAISFSHPKKAQKDEAENVDTSKRAFIATAVTLASASVIETQAKKVDGGLAVVEDKVAPTRKTAITPAGSVSAKNVQQHCTACQLCITACPNGVLRPSTDIETFMQPQMSYERGYCRPECTRCADACPVGAIKPITVEEKSSTQIGHAVWIKKNCIPLTDGVECGNCARHCPSGAIMMVPSDEKDETSVKIPAIDTEVCIGCGACENLCPARPFSAIYVEGHEVHRTI
ncbi:MAG: 4Fe-4S dicluster domain-containing protein, partial [Bacteroidaceae bacterium]|nr:4Fe-4S dicluster domain-containing protein [Bacteroidaceae bacterium]